METMEAIEDLEQVISAIMERLGQAATLLAELRASLSTAAPETGSFPLEALIKRCCPQASAAIGLWAEGHGSWVFIRCQTCETPWLRVKLTE